MSDICENTTEIELESLEAIYVNELTYSRNADGQLETIELLLHPATGHDVTKQYVCMTLVFTVSSQYPSEPPEIVIRNPRGLGEEEVISLVEDMILKAEEMRGEAMLYTLIEMAKDSITEGNLPHCPCVVCLEHFHQRDIFHRTACYHYFHNRCLYKYRLHAQAQLEVDEKEASERRHLDAGSCDKDKTGKIICPVCRSPLDEESLMVTCSREELEDDEKMEAFVIPPDLKEQQRKMLEMYEHQKAKGGIIDLEHEKNKYLVNPEDRMPVRSQRPFPVTTHEDVTKPATSKHSTRETNRDRPNNSSRQYGSSQQYRKGRGRGRGNFHSGRSYEWSDYEDRPGLRLKAKDGAGRRSNYPPGSGSRKMKDTVETDVRAEEFSGQRTPSEERRKSENTKRILETERRSNYPPGSGSSKMKDMVETDVRAEEFSGQRTPSEERWKSENTKRILETERRSNYPPGSGSSKMKDMIETDVRTEEFSGQRTPSEERRKSENTKRILETERRMKDNDTRMRKWRTDSSVNEVHRTDGGFTRTDTREKLDERYDHQRTDERQKVDRRQDNSDRYERRDDDRSNDRDIANRESRQMEAGRMTETDIENKKVENERGSFSARSYRTGVGHKREEVHEGRKTYMGGSYQTHQKYYPNRKAKENVYNNDDESNETEKDIIKKQLPRRHTDTDLANIEVQSAKNMCESEIESGSCRSDRFVEVKETLGEGKHGEMYKNSTAVRGGHDVPECDVQGASGVDRPLKDGKNAYFKDQDYQHGGYDRRDDQRLRQGYDKGSSGYQRGGGSYRGRESGSGPKQRGGKYHDGRGSYAGYSERSSARNDRAQQQHHQQQHQHHQQQQHQQHQQQQWHRHNRHGEERERVDRNVQATKERNAEDEMNSATTGQGECGTNITSETGSKDDEEADPYYQPVRPQRSTGIFSGNASEVNTTRRLISVAHQDLLDNESTEDEAKACRGVSRFYYDKHSHKNSGSEIMGSDNAENVDNNKIKAHKTYPVYSEAELKACYVGFDEVDQENWDEEMDIYHYERYKIRPQHLEEYNRQAVSRKKYYENKIREKHEQQNMIKEEQRRMLKERSQRCFRDNEMESPVKTESKKDVHMKSLLDIFKEEKAKKLATSVTMSESDGSHREIIATLSEGTVSFQSEVDRLYTSRKQKIGSGYMSQDSRGCELLANVDHEIPHTSNRLDITNQLEERENNNHMYSKGLNRKKIVNTKSEDTKTGTFHEIGHGRYSKMSVRDNNDIGMNTSGSSLDDKDSVSDVVCSSKCSLGKVAECKGVCCTDVSRRGDYRDSSVCHRGDHTDIGAGGVSHRGDCVAIGDSHISGHTDGRVSCRSSHGHNGVSSRDIHGDSGVFCRDEHRDKDVPFTSDNKDRGVSHRDENHTAIGGPAFKIEHTSKPASFIKHFKKAPPLKFPKKNRQGASSDSSSQIPVVQPAAQEDGASVLGRNACNQSRRQASQDNRSKCMVDNCVVTNSQIILSETTSATLNARPPASFTDLSTFLLDSYVASSVLSGNLLSSNRAGVGLNPSWLSLYGTYSGNVSSGYLSDIYSQRCNSVQTVGIGNSETMNTCGVGGVAPVNCMVGDGSKELGDGGVAVGKENINISPVVTNNSGIL